MRQQPSPPSTGRQGEQQQQQIRELVPPLSALSPKTAAAALGMGAGKGAAEKAAGGEFVSGNANYSSCRPHGPSTFFLCVHVFSTGRNHTWAPMFLSYGAGSRVGMVLGTKVDAK